LILFAKLISGDKPGFVCDSDALVWTPLPSLDCNKACSLTDLKMEDKRSKVAFFSIHPDHESMVFYKCSATKVSKTCKRGLFGQDYRETPLIYPIFPESHECYKITDGLKDHQAFHGDNNLNYKCPYLESATVDHTFYNVDPVITEITIEQNTLKIMYHDESGFHELDPRKDYSVKRGDSLFIIKWKTLNLISKINGRSICNVYKTGNITAEKTGNVEENDITLKCTGITSWYKMKEIELSKEVNHGFPKLGKFYQDSNGQYAYIYPSDTKQIDEFVSGDTPNYNLGSIFGAINGQLEKLHSEYESLDKKTCLASCVHTKREVQLLSISKNAIIYEEGKFSYRFKYQQQGLCFQPCFKVNLIKPIVNGDHITATTREYEDKYTHWDIATLININKTPFNCPAVIIPKAWNSTHGVMPNGTYYKFNVIAFNNIYFIEEHPFEGLSNLATKYTTIIAFNQQLEILTNQNSKNDTVHYWGDNLNFRNISMDIKNWTLHAFDWLKEYIYYAVTIVVGLLILYIYLRTPSKYTKVQEVKYI
jgi:hypothetical protein